MKQARMLALGIAVVCAVGAIFVARSLTSKTKKVEIVQQTDTIDVLVAKGEIRLGDSLKANDLRWQAWPKDAATAGYITKSRMPNAISEFSGAIARAPFLVGEPIKEQKLIKASEGGVLAAILPAGMRAISTPIREETAAGGFILPNDHVDVILIRKLRGRDGQEEHVSDTLFKNIRVLAIGQNIEMKEGKKVAEGKTATLELTPRQSELIALARSMGDISLALRSLADINNETSGPTSSDLDKSKGGQTGNAIKVLRYGVKKREYGVN